MGERGRGGHIFAALLLGCLAACDLIVPLNGSQPAAGDAFLDGPRDAPRTESGGDAGAAAPDSWPRFDGGSSCSKLWVAPESLVLAPAAHSPAIVSDGEAFYVAVATQAGEVAVRQVLPFQADPLPGGAVVVNQPGATTRIADPTISLVNAQTLALAWSEPPLNSDPGTCLHPLLLRAVSIAGGKLSPSADAPIAVSGTYPANGYGPATLVTDRTASPPQTLLASRLDWQGTDCNSHVKGVTAVIDPLSPAPFTTPNGGGYISALGTMTWWLAAAPTTQGAWYLLRLFHPDGNPSAAQAQLLRTENAPAQTWSVVAALQEGEVPLMRRPSLIAAGNDSLLATWAARTTGGAPGLALCAISKNTTGCHFFDQIASAGSNGVASPQLAYSAPRMQAAVAYTVVPATVDQEQHEALPAQSFHLALVDPATAQLSGAVQLAQQDPARPARVVVAAGKGGFGVAWTQWAADTPSVHFRWVGCLP